MGARRRRALSDPRSVDTVACCMAQVDAGKAVMQHVSEEHLLHECRHWTAGHHTTELLEPPVGASGIQAFYSHPGAVLLGTVVDGDCGLDVACMMLGVPLEGRRHTRTARSCERKSGTKCASALRSFGVARGYARAGPRAPPAGSTGSSPHVRTNPHRKP